MRRGSRSFALVGVVALLAVGMAGPVSGRSVALRQPPMLEVGALLGDAYPLAAPPTGLTPEQRAAWVTDSLPVLGRTPTAWREWALSAFDLDAVTRTATLRHDLVTEVARIYTGLGLPVDRAALRAEASRLPAALRAPFADVVAVVADAQDGQAPIAAAVEARLRAGWTPEIPLLTAIERDLMLAAQSRITDAISEFRLRTRDAFEGPAGDGDGPLFSDPEGLIVLGGTGNEVYERAGLLPDPVLLIDPAGSDTYENSAGGACPLTTPNFGTGIWMDCNELLVSVVADLGDGTTAPSDDRYLYDGPPAAIQGAGGPGGLGLLIDVGGNDVYDARMTRGNWQPFQPVLYYLDGGAQGFGYAGVGALIDGVGDDQWLFAVDSTHGNSIWGLGQGFGGAGGVGIASDGAGSDRWIGLGLGLGPFPTGGFQGLYTNGTGFYGGVGIMTDTGLGDDYYYSSVSAESVDYYAFAFGAFGGLGVMYEDGGNDYYYTFEEAFDGFDPLLNCAYGTASYGGVGVFVDLGGNDTYIGGSVSPYHASVMDNGFGGPGAAYGVFVDIGGDDHYEMFAEGGKGEMIMGRGLWEPALLEGDPVNAPAGHNSWGTFVDLLGNDTYIGGPGANNSQWPFGVDRGL